MNHPDLIIMLDADGKFLGIKSTLPLTYQTATASPGEDEFKLSEAKENEFLGTYPQIMKELGLLKPTKEFNPNFVYELCCTDSVLRKSFESFGFKANKESNFLTFNHAALKALRATYNAFIKSNDKYMQAYLNVQK